MLKNKRGFFQNLILSYIIIICLSVTISGIFPYNVYSHYYKNEVNAINQRVISYLRMIIHNFILSDIDNIYGDILYNDAKKNEIDSFLYGEVNNNNILEIYNLFQEYTAKKDSVISNIHLYSYKNGQLISTKYGIKGADNLLVNLDFIKLIDPDDKAPQWIPPRAIYPLAMSDSSPETVMTKVFWLGNNEERALMAIDVNENVLYNTITMLSSQQYDYIFITDEKGTVLTHKNKDLINKNVGAEFNVIFKNGNSSGNYEADVNGRTNIISYTTIPSNNWKIILVASSDKYYPAQIRIMYIFTSVITITLLLGIMIAFAFSKRFSAPIKNLIASFKMKNSAPLDSVVTQVVKEMSELTSYVEENSEIIQNSFLICSYYNSFSSEEDIIKRSSILPEEFFREKYTAFVIKIERLPEDSTEQKMYFTYEILTRLSNSFDGVCVISAEIASGVVTAVAAHTSEYDATDIFKFMRERLEGLEKHITLYFAETCENITCLTSQFKHIKEIFEYRFFYPEAEVLFYSNIKSRIASDTVNSDIQFDISELQEDNINSLIDDFTDKVIESDMSVTAAQQLLLRILSDIAVSAKNYGIHLKKYNDISAENINSIFEYSDMIKCICREYVLEKQKRLNNKNYLLIENIKMYVEENCEKDISLQILAEYSGMNHTYLSKIFKAETGKNLVDYIKGVKLARAERLLVETNMTIQDIAYKLDYSAPHYFIKIFKEHYGVTPKVYRQVANSNK